MVIFFPNAVGFIFIFIILINLMWSGQPYELARCHFCWTAQGYFSYFSCFSVTFSTLDKPLTSFHLRLSLRLFFRKNHLMLKWRSLYHLCVCQFCVFTHGRPLLRTRSAHVEASRCLKRQSRTGPNAHTDMVHSYAFLVSLVLWTAQFSNWVQIGETCWKYLLMSGGGMNGAAAAATTTKRSKIDL